MSFRLGLAGAICAALMTSAPCYAGTQGPDQGLQNIGLGVAIALPAFAGGYSLWNEDWNGAGQLVLVGGATVGTTDLISQELVKEDKPYCQGEKGCPDRAFPANEAGLAFAPAQYMWDRYGWQYGLPAYVAATFVGSTEVISSQHRWWDVASSGGIAWVYSHFITQHYYQPQHVYSDLYATPKGAMVAFNYSW
jgi:hypothetical protein